MTAALKLPSLPDEKQDWTVDDLASLPPDLRYELIDGRLIVPSPTAFHQILGVEIVLALRPGCPPGYVPVPDLSLSIDRRNEPRPDVVVVRQSVALRTPVPIEAAMLLVEVISPTSHLRDMDAKKALFARVGVGNYWVIDPTFEKGVALTEFRLGENGQYDIVTDTDKVFMTDMPYPAMIDLPALTGLRDDYRRAQTEA